MYCAIFGVKKEKRYVMKNEKLQESLRSLLASKGAKINLYPQNVADCSRTIDFLEQIEKSEKLNDYDRAGISFKIAHLRDIEARLQSQPLKFLLINKLKDECVLRSFLGCQKKLVVDTQCAILILQQCSNIVEGGAFNFKICPLDRESAIVDCYCDLSQLPNGYIYTINEKYNIDIPLKNKEDMEIQADDFDDYIESKEREKRYIYHGKNLK